MRVKDAIAQVNTLLQQLAEGIRAASLVTILAGLLVLAGAIAAGARARLYDATVLKVLGATRRQIALVYVLEYGLLGIATGIIALGAGTLAAAVIASSAEHHLSSSTPARCCGRWWAAAAATLLFGLLGAIGGAECPAGRATQERLTLARTLTLRNPRLRAASFTCCGLDTPCRKLTI